MKKSVSGIFFVCLMLISIASFVSAGCVDSETSEDISVKGIVQVSGQDGSLIGGIQEDYCMDDKLMEISCLNDNESKIETIDCPNGCYDGACLSEDITCTDSDGGNVANVKGELISKGSELGLMEEEDECTDKESVVYLASKSRLHEVNCNEENMFSAKNLDCAYGCFEGACLEKDVCIDSDVGENEIYVEGYSFSNVDLQNLPNVGELAQKDVCDLNGNLLESYCNEDKKMDIKKIECLNGCKQGKCCSEDKPCIREISEVGELNKETCDNGCKFEEKCYPFGFRVEESYCDLDNEMKEQKTFDENGDWASCQNNHECKSNICTDGKCVDVQRLMEQLGLFKRLLCRLAHPFDEDARNLCYQGFIEE